MSTKSKGIITRITGPVVDIRFGGLELPDIFHAVEILNGDNVFSSSETGKCGAYHWFRLTVGPAE